MKLFKSAAVLVCSIGVVYGCADYFAIKSFDSGLNAKVAKINEANVAKAEASYSSAYLNPFKFQVVAKNFQLTLGEPAIGVITADEMNIAIDQEMSVKGVSVVSMAGNAILSVLDADEVFFTGLKGGSKDFRLKASGVEIGNVVYKKYIADETLEFVDALLKDKALGFNFSVKERASDSEVEKYSLDSSIYTKTGFHFDAHTDYQVVTKGSSIKQGEESLSPTSDILISTFSFGLEDSGFREILFKWGARLYPPEVPNQKDLFKENLYKGLDSLVTEVWQDPLIPKDALKALNVFIRDGRKYTFESKFNTPMGIDAFIADFYDFSQESVYSNAKVSFKVEP